MTDVRSPYSVYRPVLALLLMVQVVGFFSTASWASAAAPHQSRYSNQFSQDSFLTLANDARVQNGVQPLFLNEELVAAAEAKAEDMADKGYWDHFRPSDNKAPWAFIEEAGYTYKVAGENLARGFKTPEGITAAWLQSPSHRANILSPKYSEVGFASIESVDQEGNQILLTVEMFGSR